MPAWAVSTPWKGREQKKRKAVVIMDKVIIVIDEKIAGRSKKMKKAIECLAFNPMCYDCKNFKNGCTGETNKIYSNCVYKERDGKKEDIYMLIRKAIFN